MTPYLHSLGLGSDTRTGGPWGGRDWAAIGLVLAIVALVIVAVH